MGLGSCICFYGQHRRARIKSRDRILSGGHTVLVLEPELSEQDYLRQIELLALDVVAAAREEGWHTYGDDPADVTRMQRSVNELARILRHH